MGGLKQTVLFLLSWLIVLPAFAVVSAAPDLSVVQREKETLLVFSWDTPVDFDEKTENGEYRLSFKAAVAGETVSPDQIRAALPSMWRRIRFVPGAARFDVIVPLPEKGLARAKREGRSVLLSFSEKASSENRKAKKSAGRKSKAAALRQKTEPVGKNEEKTATAPLPAREDVKPAKQVEKPEKTKIEPEKTEAVPAEKVQAAEKTAPVDPEAEKAEKEKLIAAEEAVAPYTEEQRNVSLVLSDPKSFETVRENALSEDHLAQSGYRAVTLSFPWTRMTGCAAFRRDGYLWLIFDRQGEFDFTLERELYKDIIYEMVQIPHSQATVFRLVTAKGYNPGVRREGLLWIVDLMYQPIRPREPADLILQRKTAFGPRIFIPLDEAPQVLPLLDPEVGDLMYVIPVFARGKGVAHARSFVDVSFLQTAQGIAIIPNIEDINVFASTSGVEVRGPKGGMRFSSEDILSYLTKLKITQDPLAQILDIAGWGYVDASKYVETLKGYKTNVSKAEGKDRDVQRLILARFYFANGMYPETLSVLSVIEADNKKMAELPGFIALRGAANFMMMRYDEAIKDFSSPVLKGDLASEYWRAATLSASSRSPGDYLAPMKENMAVLQSYPQTVKTRLALAGLHAAVAAGDEFSIQNFMEAANNSGNSDAENDEIAFYHALWQESTGMYSLARDEMKRLAEGKNLYFRAMGGLEKIRMDDRVKAATPQERIAELERLSYAWRGDEFEYNLMTRLVAAYKEQKDYAQVLQILKNMRIRFKGTGESEKIQKLMEDIFQKIYLDEGIMPLPPVKAIALYEEFKDLTPPGEKGAQIIEKLADRLVSIDLLDRAAALLESQLKQKIGNKEYGLISSRLALVRLLNREPEKALETLNLSNDKPFSEKLKRQRLHIRAKALAYLKKTDEACELLEQDDSESAKMLRAEIYWQAQQWDKAADALKLLIKKPEPKKKLSPQEAQHILDWAAALRLAGRTKIVTRVRENFLPLMKETDLAQAFDFITKNPQQGLMDYHLVAQEVESAENFHTFAKDYTNMVKTKGLSETVR